MDISYNPSGDWPDGYKYRLQNKSDSQIIDEIEKVRTKNNVNWMDVLRLAFKHAPEDARDLIAKINGQDKEISSLLEQLSKN